jgi:hypothetical protein
MTIHHTNLGPFVKLTEINFTIAQKSVTRLVKYTLKWIYDLLNL